MTITQIPAEAAAARKAQHLRNIGELDYRRSVVRLRQRGYTQQEIADLVRVSQPNVQKLLQRAESVPMPPDGFSGADPYEICERYAAGQIDHSQLINELTRWDYREAGRTKDLLDDLVVPVPGSTDDLQRALRRGLIEEDTFYEVLDQVEARLGHQ